MVKKKTKDGENLELAKEHVKIAGDLVYEESDNEKSKKDKKNKDTIKRTIFSLERAESGIEELKAVAAGFLALVGIGSGFYLLSPVVTGRVIFSEGVQPVLSVAGVILIVAGLFAGYVAVKKKMKE